MSVLLPADLPAGFTLEPATGAHAPEVFEVVAAEQVAAYGFCPDTEEDVRAELEPPEAGDSMELVVRDGVTGRVVQWWAAIRIPGDHRFHSWIASHPQVDDDAHDALTAAAWTTMLGWIRDLAPDGVEPIEVHSGCPAGSGPGHRRLAAAGFAHRRTFWEMIGPVTDNARTPPAVPGLTISATEDTHTLHRLLNEAFVGHWGFTPLGYDDWLAVEKTGSGYDPALWFLAGIDGEPAAAMLLSRRLETEDAMYVAELATLEQYRRRGIASALLAHAFDLAAREGLGQLSLHVDSENSHDAPSVYRKAGLAVRCAFDGYVLELQR